MLREIKELLLEFGLVGMIFGLLSVIWTRESLSRADKIKKVFSSIALSLIVGNICMGMGVNAYLTFAIIGGSCSFAREIFDFLSVVLRLLIDKPLQTIKSVVEIVRGGRNDKSENN